MLGYIWLFLIITSFIAAAVTGRVEKVTFAAMNSAKDAVTISISLIGIMALWLGFMNLAEKSGLISFISKLIKPVTKRLFPQVPPDNPAIGNIALNFSANALGVTNAATPIGIKAMEDLQGLNPKKTVATNAMCTFLAINTAGFQLIPASAIAVLIAAGAKNPTVIIAPTLVTTLIALCTAIFVVKVLEKFPAFALDKYKEEE